MPDNQSAVPVSQRAREAAASIWRWRGDYSTANDTAAGRADNSNFVKTFAAFERDILAGQSVPESFAKWLKRYVGEQDAATMRFSVGELELAFNAGSVAVTPADVADLREAAIEAIAQIEMDREGYPLSRTQQEIYDDAAETFDAIASLIAGPLPEGFVSVPVEPTETMIMKGVTVCCAAHNVADASRVWSAMIAARPTGES